MTSMEIPWQIVAVAIVSVAAILIAMLMFLRDQTQAADLRQRDYERLNQVRDAQVIKSIKDGYNSGHKIYLSQLEQQQQTSKDKPNGTTE